MPDMRDEPLRDLPEILTPEQCADVLQVSRDTMRALISDGIVPAFRLGPRTTRVFRDELIRAIEDARIQGVEDGEEQIDG
ncbi:helix-turn-helix domain-containing protein [Brachybacterium sp. UNK5269]|uniref:helix-turn-helix domain-containing protein n=1 Tax=Brachybacterium sp. UNK5269 TaxID=3408576 RepID=UPI003BAED2E9